MEFAILAGVIIYLGAKAFFNWLLLGGVVSYVVANDYPLPDKLSPWCEWYLKKKIGLKADLPGRTGEERKVN